MVDDEDAALILLMSLLLPHENFVDSYISVKDTPTLEEVKSTLLIRETCQRVAGLGTDSQISRLAATQSKGCENSSKKKNRTRTLSYQHCSDLFNVLNC